MVSVCLKNTCVKKRTRNINQAATLPTRATTASKIKEDEDSIEDALLVLPDLLAYVERVSLTTLFLVAKTVQTISFKSRCNTLSKHLYV